MSPEAIAAVVVASLTLLGMTAKGLNWIVRQITSALDAIREAIDGVKGEVAELRSDLDKIASTTAANTNDLTDHEARLRYVEAILPKATTRRKR